MAQHFLGSNENSGGREDATPSAYGTSLVVWQFFELVNGSLPVHKPRNGFRTIKVVLDVRYCLRCCGERRHDVWFGRTFGAHAQDFSMGRCRCCGEEVRYG